PQNEISKRGLIRTISAIAPPQRKGLSTIHLTLCRATRVSVSASTTFPARTLSHLDIVGLADASGAMHPKNVTGVRIGGTLPSAVASMSGCFGANLVIRLPEDA